MSYIKQMMILCLTAAVLFTGGGCGLITVGSVAMIGGKEVAKKVYQKHQENKEEDQQQANS